jgi:hypothetical protein
MDKEKILQKVNDNLPLTPEEELFYLSEIIGYSRQEAERIIEIADNANPNILID